MNSLIALFSLFFIISEDDKCLIGFYNASLKDTVITTSPFVKVQFVDSSGIQKSRLLPNCTLYKIVSKKLQLDYPGYLKFMSDFYITKRMFNYTEFNELSAAVLIDDDKYVENIARKGRNVFIKHFFINGVFDFKYIKHFETVVGKLFDWGILVANVEGAEVIIYRSPCY